VIGSLKKPADSLERSRVDAGVWLNTCSRGDFQGRELLDLMHVRTSSAAINCRVLR
jgi:hypothetical protein